MNQPFKQECLADTARVAAPVIEPFAHDHKRTPLERLIHLLAASSDASLADSGIAQLSRDQLDLMSVNAEEESETCLDYAFVLLGVMEHTLDNGCPPSVDELLAMTQHVRCQLQNHKRWHTLADNAAYYRDHPDIAARIDAASRKQS